MRGGEFGFTLVELMVTLAIVSILTASLVRMFSSMAVDHTGRVSSADLQQSVRAVMELMSREIRMAGFSSLRPGRFGITKAGTQALEFTVDWNDDGNLTDSHSSDPSIAQESDRIGYRFDGDLNSLVRTTAISTSAESNQPLLGGKGDPMKIDGLTFHYYDDRGEETAHIEDIRSVAIEISAALPAGRKGSSRRSYRAYVLCRNLGL